MISRVPALPSWLILAWRNVMRQWSRNTFALGAVCVSIVAMMLAAGFIEWIYWQLREATIYAQLGHVQITRQGYAERGLSDPFAYLLPGGGNEIRDVEALSETRAVAPRTQFSGLISLGSHTISFVGEGVDPEREADLSRWVKIEAGENLSKEDPKGVILGEGLAKALAAEVSDKVVLLATTSNGGTNAVELTVRGLFSTASKDYDDSALRMDFGVSQGLLRIRGAHKWIVLLERTEDTEVVTEKLRAGPLGGKFDIAPWYDLADFYNKAKSLFARQVGVLKLIISIAIVLAISNSFVMNVISRTYEIGTAAAIGIRRRHILLQFMTEGVLIGMAGGLLGIVLGTLAAQAISAVGIPMPPPPGTSHGYMGKILVTPQLALEALLLAFFTSLAASSYPAWRAASVDITTALRHGR